MGKAHSVDLRERVYGDVTLGKSRGAAAQRFGVSASTDVRLARRMVIQGRSIRRLRGGRVVRQAGGPSGSVDRLD